MQRLILRHGDCVEVLKGYEDGSIGAIVSDPPYDLTAVSRGGSSRQADTGPFGRHELDTVTIRGGFMGKKWDGTGIAFSADLWDEVYRVLRPGGVVKAFSGTRTFHRMAAAMAEAGFLDLRIESWNYGSGFPKSMNIGKALDALLLTGGSHSTNIKAVNALRPGEGVLAGALPNNGIMSEDTRAGSVTNDNPATESAHHWQGWGTALKPSWEPVVVGRKPE